MVYISKSFQGILNFGAKREIFENAKELRKNQTEAEKALWKAVRSRRLEGINYPATSGRGMKDPTHKAKNVSPQAAGNLTLKILKFRRQHPVKEFILDFYCHEYLLGIEIDGSVHENDEAKEYDLNRTTELENLGLTLLRFKNEEVLTNLSKVITEIRNKVVQLKNSSIQ